MKCPNCGGSIPVDNGNAKYCMYCGTELGLSAKAQVEIHKDDNDLEKQKIELEKQKLKAKEEHGDNILVVISLIAAIIMVAMIILKTGS